MTGPAIDLPRQLADAVRAAGARVRVGYPRWLRPFLLPGVVGITLGRTIYLLPEFVNDDRSDVARLVRHELVHVRQMNRLTLPVFVIRYAAEFAAGLVRERSLDRAYRSISLEEEAFREERKDDLSHGSDRGAGL